MEEKKLILRQATKFPILLEEGREQEDSLPSPSKQGTDLAKSAEALEQIRIDTVLYNLFFNDSTKLISSESTFDPAMRYLHHQFEKASIYLYLLFVVWK